MLVNDPSSKPLPMSMDAVIRLIETVRADIRSYRAYYYAFLALGFAVPSLAGALAEPASLLLRVPPFILWFLGMGAFMVGVLVLSPGSTAQVLGNSRFARTAERLRGRVAGWLDLGSAEVDIRLNYSEILQVIKMQTDGSGEGGVVDQVSVYPHLLEALSSSLEMQRRFAKIRIVFLVGAAALVLSLGAAFLSSTLAGPALAAVSCPCTGGGSH